MINTIHVQIPMAMQLSLVIFLVLFSFNKTIGKAVEQQHSAGGHARWLIGRSPLQWIGIGFIFNFLYLLIELGSINKNVELFQLKPENLNNFSLFFDLCTTVCFVIGSTKMKSSRVASETNGRLMKWKFSGLRLAILLLLFLYVLFSNWGRIERHLPYTWSLYTLNFLSYTACSFLLLNKFRIRTNGRLNANYWVFAGFLVWALLQIIGLFSNISDNATLLLVGFSISLAAKGSIFYGLYDFSIKVTTEADMQKQIEDNLQKIQSAKLEANNRDLNEINILIEDIYAQKDNTELLKKMLEHLVYSRIFEFDYALFSEVDKFQEFVQFSGHALANPNADLEDIFQWVNENGFPLSHHDIMSRTITENRVIHVVGNTIDGNLVDLDASECILDPEVFRIYRHDRLDRFFIPVSNSRLLRDAETVKLSLEENKIIGIVEVGLNKDQPGYKPDLITERVSRLDLYLNNVSKNFLRNRMMDEKVKTTHYIESFERNANHLEFLYNVLAHCAKEIKADAGDMSFISLDNTQIWLEESKTWGCIKLADIKKAIRDNHLAGNPRKGIFRQVVETTAPYYTNDAKKDPYFITELVGIHAQLSVPLMYTGTVIGVLSFYSKTPYSFNSDKQRYVQQMADLATETFLRLKLSSAVSSLVIPYNMYDKEQILDATYERIYRYYSCSYIAIWEGLEENSHQFQPAYLSRNLKQFASYPSLHGTDLHSLIYQPTEPLVVSLIEENDSYNELEKAFIEHFNSIIYLPLGRNRGITRFITLFCKAEVTILFPEDKTFFAHLSNKLNLSLNFYDIYSFFDKLTREAYQRSKYEILNDFLPYLKRISGADLPLLFTYDATQQSFFKVFGLENNFKQDQLITRLESAEIMKNDFSYSIIKNGSKWIDNREQYLAYRNTLPKWEGWNVFTKDFWEREKIKSLAAIRVEFEGEPLGVLFFNYREEEQTLNDQTSDYRRSALAKQNQTLLNLLANLIGRVMKIADTFEQQREYWEEQTTDVFLQVQAETAMGMIHNIHNIYANISYKFEFHREELEKIEASRNVTNSLTELGEAIFEFLSDYLVYREYLSFGQFAVERVPSGKFFKELQQIFRYYLLRSQSRTKIIVEAAESIRLHCDRVQFGHVLLNLIKNAIEASARIITIKLIEADSTRKFRVIEISDDGIGIKDEHKSKIFQQRFTTKVKGTGMGLPVCKNVMEKHGGRIDFHSIYNKNKKSFTTFTVYLPILK